MSFGLIFLSHKLQSRRGRAQFVYCSATVVYSLICVLSKA